MKKFINKKRYILLISLLAILMLAGCGRQNSETDKNEAEATPTSALAKEPTTEATTTEELATIEEPKVTEAPATAEEPETTEVLTTEAMATEEPTTPQTPTTPAPAPTTPKEPEAPTTQAPIAEPTPEPVAPEPQPTHTHSWTDHTWTEVIHGQDVPVFTCRCGIDWYSMAELNAHQAEVSLCTGYSSGTDWGSDTQVTHHYRECACGAREDID